MKKINKIIFYLSIIILIILFISIKISNFPFSLMYFSGCGDSSVCGIISADIVIFILILLAMISSLFIVNTKRITMLIIIYIFSIILILWVGSFEKGRCRAVNNYNIQAIKDIEIKQIIYYSINGVYANNYTELGITEKKDSNTNKIIADKDGVGFDGGDNDPNTWSARVFIKQPKFKYCRLLSDGYWLTCNQDGCDNVIK